MTWGELDPPVELQLTLSYTSESLMLGSVRKQMRQTRGGSDQILERRDHCFSVDLHFELVGAFRRRLDENIPKLKRGLSKRKTAKTREALFHVALAVRLILTHFIHLLS